jgi:predicted SPOUT superfamily RNA methylase MTH1
VQGEKEVAKKQLAVAVPASVISDVPHLREKTSKIGMIGRAAAIFRVNEIIVYADNPRANQNRDLTFITLLLRYLETPQYLRKRLFELKPELQYAGILPPLRTPHHPVSGKTRDLTVGEYREGVVLEQERNGVLVEIGVDQPAMLYGEQASVNTRLTTKVVKVGGQIEVQIARREDIQQYWGYSVTEERRGLRAMLEARKFDLTVGTSKLAPTFQEVKKQLSQKWSTSQKILVLFGSPSRGLFEIAKEEGDNLNELVNLVVNTVPNQGTETVRTEEALLATLAIFNVQFAS